MAQVSAAIEGNEDQRAARRIAGGETDWAVDLREQVRILPPLFLSLLLVGCSLEDPPAPCANPRTVQMLDYGQAGFLNSPKRKWREVKICE